MSSTQPRSEFGDRYELREPIARGGMGDVHAAWDTQMDRPVAVKLLRPDLAHLPGMRARLQVEARTAAKLAHSNVVAVFDSGVHEGRPFIAMELLEGRTLADEIAKGAFPERRVVEVGLQVLAALAAAHAVGILHRDVKPGNVLVAEEHLWKVGDFGIAKWTGAEVTVTRTGELLGSPSYFAPERLTGSPASAASDIYSLGVVLYEALAGRRPFEGTDAWGVALEIREGRFAPLRSVRADADPDLCSPIERAMASDPRERFQTAEAMARALRDCPGAPPPASAATPALAASALDVAHEPTIVVRREPTAVLEPMPPQSALPAAPVQVVSRREPEGRSAAENPKPRARDLRSAERILAIVVAVVLAVGLVLALSFLGGHTPTTSSPRPPSAPGSPIPRELDRALERLTDSVRP
jgi:serine/threonine protein kinase